jgi:hypothetical protein
MGSIIQNCPGFVDDHAPQPARHGLDRGRYPGINAAAAEIGAHNIVDIGFGSNCQQRRAPA